MNKGVLYTGIAVGAFLAGSLLAFAWLRREQVVRADVLVAGAAILGSTDASYRGQAKFNVVFNRLGPAGAGQHSRFTGRRNGGYSLM